MCVNYVFGSRIQSLTSRHRHFSTPTSVPPTRHLIPITSLSSPILVLETQNPEASRTKKSGSIAVDVASNRRRRRRRLSSASAVPLPPPAFPPLHRLTITLIERLRREEYVLLGLQHTSNLCSNCGFDGFHRRR